MQQISQITNQQQSPPKVQEFQEDSSHSNKVIIILVILGFYFFIFAMIQLITNTSQKVYSYQLNCNNTQVCISQPQFLSFSNNQIISVYLLFKGISQHDIYTYLNSDPSIPQNLIKINSQCGKYRTNIELNQIQSINNTILNPTDVAIPCGYFESIYPENTLNIIQVDTNSQLKIQTNLIQPIKQLKNININKQWINLNDPHFNSWLQQSIALTLTKYWGYIISQVSGTYYISIKFKKQQPKTNKYILLFQNNQALGGYNLQLCIVYFLYGFVMFLFALFTFFLKDNFIESLTNKIKNQIESNWGESDSISRLVKQPQDHQNCKERVKPIQNQKQQDRIIQNNDDDNDQDQISF